MTRPVVKAELHLDGSRFLAQMQEEKANLKDLLEKAQQTAQEREGCARD